MRFFNSLKSFNSLRRVFWLKRAKLSKFHFLSEDGSLSVLISSLFLVALILSVGIIDISDSYLAKRELTQIGEDSLLIASHSLDQARYYARTSSNSPDNSYRVPIDCSMAYGKFTSEISARALRNNSIVISGWNCVNDQITASISSSIQAIVSFPLFTRISGGRIDVSSTIGATSELVG